MSFLIRAPRITHEDTFCGKFDKDCNSDIILALKPHNGIGTVSQMLHAESCILTAARAVRMLMSKVQLVNYR